MKKIKSASFFISIITASFVLLYGGYEGWYSFILIWVFLCIFSVVFLRSNYVEDNREVISLFLMGYSFYSLYMMITNYIYVDDPNTEFFMMVDSMKFWSYSDQTMNSFDDVLSNQSIAYEETIRYTFFNFGNLLLSFFAQLIDENNILLQKIQSVWLGAFSLPFIYLSIKKYFNKNKAFKYTLIFGIFTHVCIYSVVFNRDPHVYFLYVLGFYLVVNYDTKRHVFLKLSAILILISGYRLEHGLFFVSFLLAYLYLRAGTNGNIKALVVVLIPIFGLILAPFMFGKLQDNTDAYTDQIERVDRTEVSTAATLTNLPPGIKQIAMGVNSQIAPAIPFWRTWFPRESDRSYQRLKVAGYFTPWRFMESIANIVWLYVWGFIVVGLVLKKQRLVPKELNYLLIVAILLILAASTSVNARRTYCVYPIVFLYSLWMYNLLPKGARAVVMNYTSLLILILTCLFIYIK